MRRRRPWIMLSVMALLALVALVVPQVSPLSPLEQHVELALAPPGTRVVPLHEPSYDGDTSWLAVLDTDHSGALECTLTPAPPVATPGATYLSATAPELAEEVDQSVEALDPAIPFQAILAGHLGTISCPEIAKVNALRRPLTLAVATADADGDGCLERDELPEEGPGPWASVASLLGVAPEALFDHLDDGDGCLSQGEVAEGTRILALDGADLVARFDHDGDLAISADELPGLPETTALLLGADGLGRDCLTRLATGLGTSLVVGILATLISVVIGTLVGASAGLRGGWIDRLVVRSLDVVYALPFTFVVILVVAVFGQGLVKVLVALGLVQWMTVARIARAEAARMRTGGVVEAAKAAGATRTRVLLVHVLPHIMGAVVAYGALMVPIVILEEAFLSFLGLGVQPPETSIGILVADGMGTLPLAAHPLIPAVVVLAVVLVTINVLADDLGDRLAGARVGRGGR